MKSATGSTPRRTGKNRFVELTPARARRAVRSANWPRLRAMSDEEIERNAREDPDSDVAIPVTRRDIAFVPALPDVAAIRGKLGLSQSAFAAGFGIRLATLRNWEQGRVVPDGPARILLTVIDRDPQAVMAALNVAGRRQRARMTRARQTRG